jgi:phenylalanyl-tRNA synthetase beta chain
LLVGLYSREQSRFVELLNTVEKLLIHLGLPFDFAPRQDKFPNALIPGSWKGTHPHEYTNIRIQGKFQGAATTVHPSILKNFKSKGFFSLAVIDFTDFEKRESKDKTKYSPIAKFPSASFDISVKTSLETPAGDVLKALQAGLKLKQLKTSSILGVYAFSESEKSVTIRSVFEDSTATMTSEFLKEAEKQVAQVLEKAGFPLRA